MRPVVSADEMRAAEDAVFAAEPGVDLMSRAAAAVVEITEVMAEGPVLVLVGSGNNGGDGLFAAARLAASRPVSLWLVGSAVHAEGVAAARAAGCRELDAAGAVAALDETSLVIDALVGIGGRPGLRPEAAVLAEACEALGVPVLAVELPSGLDADSGHAHPSFRAARTVTFAAPKRCHVLEPARSRCGRVIVAEIGVPVPETGLRQIDEADVARWWPVPDWSSDKYSRGVVGLHAGSRLYPGAAILSCAGALGAGAGMVRYLGASGKGLILGRFPSVVTAPGRVQAHVVGSGWGESNPELLRRLKNSGLPVVADADALASLPLGDGSGGPAESPVGGVGVLAGPPVGTGASVARVVSPEVAARSVSSVGDACPVDPDAAARAGCLVGTDADPLTTTQASGVSARPGAADDLLHGWLLTPHAGELARLLGVERAAVVADPVGHARAAAAATGATVLLKGATQCVAEPNGRVTFAVAGPAWTAQAGSGDVLAGAAGSLLAAGLEPWKAGVLAASLQAMTARRHPGPLTPDALAAHFPSVIGDITTTHAL
ncbi:NAD(P)H-hydrate epimerase [Tessaracoccus caeni]|uniref:NAD(P)H-hydrate epimerase n=1 Tax=Tessaracoccus caeni TaxID=3031239 RepID=UPI0023DA7EB4|nr:NAD(P)H-hydrate epimerase [Tessaracoccus caeni]MDF1488262.1 NAD(P)H-hydrate epimerase [Tessaracoccus caeni]